MKKLALLLIIVLLCLSLAACETSFIPLDSHREIDSSDVASIQFVEYDNPNQKIFYFLTPHDELPFKEENCTVIESLNEDKKEEFLEELGELTVVTGNYHNDSPNGICLKINYTNGDFLIVSYNEENDGYVGDYAADGSVNNYYGNTANFGDWTNNFFEYQIPVPEGVSDTWFFDGTKKTFRILKKSIQNIFRR